MRTTTHLDQAPHPAARAHARRLRDHRGLREHALCAAARGAVDEAGRARLGRGEAVPLERERAVQAPVAELGAHDRGERERPRRAEVDLRGGA